MKPNTYTPAFAFIAAILLLGFAVPVWSSEAGSGHPNSVASTTGDDYLIYDGEGPMPEAKTKHSGHPNFVASTAGDDYLVYDGVPATEKDGDTRRSGHPSFVASTTGDDYLVYDGAPATTPDAKKDHARHSSELTHDSGAHLKR